MWVYYYVYQLSRYGRCIIVHQTMPNAGTYRKCYSHYEHKEQSFDYIISLLSISTHTKAALIQSCDLKYIGHNTAWFTTLG